MDSLLLTSNAENMPNSAENYDETSKNDLDFTKQTGINYLFMNIFGLVDIKQCFFLFIFYIAVTSTYFDEYFITVQDKMVYLLEQTPLTPLVELGKVSNKTKPIDILIIKALVFILLTMGVQIMIGAQLL
jgi:hypothetical protein